MRWMLPPECRETARELARQLGITEPASRVLIRRGYNTEEQATRFLWPNIADLHSPALLKTLPDGARRLNQAIRDGERILLYGDYDVDGTMAVVILTKAIEVCGGKSEFHVPHRL